MTNEPSSTALRWGIVGCGDVCEVKSGPGFRKARGSELVAVMRRDAPQARDYARRHGVPRWYANAGELIADDEVDAVYVATPPGSHRELAEQVAAAGTPCLVEKPMARNTRECEAMIAAFAEAGVPLFVAYYRRCLPRFEKVAKLLPQIGSLESVHYELQKRPLVPDDHGQLPWRVRAEDSGGGQFLDMGCHALDLIDHLLGPLHDVSGTAANRGGLHPEEDFVEMRWSHANGARGEAVFDFTANDDADELSFVGADGSLSVSVFADAPVKLTSSAGEELFTVPHPPHVHQPLIQCVVDQLAGTGSCPASAEAALRTSRVMDRVLEGYYGDRQSEFWLEPDAWPRRHLAIQP